MKIINTALSLNEKLKILSDAAKYDVACTSSGSDRRGQKGMLGNSCAAGICHSFAGDGRCISLLKILQSNDCIYHCKYCLNRAENDCVRATFTPDEICTLVTEFYRRNYIEGLFLSSGVVKDPAYTMELMYRTLLLLRTRYAFNGYIHVKTIPYAPPELIEQTGYLADRMSINLELPTREGLTSLAPQKTRSSILVPMRQIQNRIADYRLSIGKDAVMERSRGNRYLDHSIFATRSQDSRRGEQILFGENSEILPHRQVRPDSARVSLSDSAPDSGTTAGLSLPHTAYPDSPTSAAAPTGLFPDFSRSRHTPAAHTPDGRPRPFAPAGQSTQMIIGATGESDYEILSTTQALYQQFDLKRVFFSAYVPLNEDSTLPAIGTPPPLLREHRLYQADWLLRNYGFRVQELLSPEKPDFNLALDPKCDWALRHLEQFPVEVTTADYGTLMRVPGIGNKSALRILRARHSGTLSFEAIRKMGVVLKRAQYFITCHGRMYQKFRLEEGFITRQLTGLDDARNWNICHPDTCRQLSLFDYAGFH